MSSLRVRFRFNQQKGGKASVGIGATGKEKFTRVIVEQVAFTYSDHLFEKLKRDIAGRMHNDIDRELDKMARMFFAGVIGIPGRNLGPTGTLSPSAPVSQAMRDVPFMHVNARQLSGSWPRRSPFYLRDRGGNPPWFRYRGGTLDSLRNAKTWTAAYGPISIDVQRHTTITRRDTQLTGVNPGVTYPNRLGGTRGGTMHVGVATIRVSAMNRIGTNMLPALSGGSLSDFGSNPRGNGLLRLLGERIAWRLGGNPITVPFRPTVQPFLNYFLMRQLPNAVFMRIEQGLEGKLLTEGTGSAGRTR